MKKIAISALKVLGAVTLISQVQLVSAQSNYPNKPIKYIVPVAAGGGSDMVGREVMDKLGKVLGQTVVVDNQGGGGGGEIIAVGTPEDVAKVKNSYTGKYLAPLLK